MNRYDGNIVKVECHGALTMATVALSGGVEISAIVIETPESAPHLKEGEPVTVLFKETEVILSTGKAEQVGIKNRIPGKVGQVETGVLLSRVALETPLGDLEAILATGELETLGLAKGDPVTAMVKVNEVMLSAV